MTPIFITNPELIRFAIVLFRVSGIMVFAPFFSGQSFPYQVRIVFSLVAALVLVPSMPLSALPAEFGLGQLAGFLLSEILLGMVIGIVASFVFAGMQMAGQIISFQLGFSLINLIDPQTAVESPVFSFLQNYIGLLFFLLLNGHHWFFRAVNESFRYLPVGGIQLRAPLVEHVIRLSSQVFIIGLKIAGPVLIVTILCDVVMGITGRIAPQIPIFIVGMPMKILVGFGCLSFSFYFLPHLLEKVFSSFYETLFLLVRTMT